MSLIWAIFLLVVYLVPFLAVLRRVAGFALPETFFAKMRRWNELTGRMEYLFGHVRDYILGPVMTGLAVVCWIRIMMAGADAAGTLWSQLAIYGCLAGISIYTYNRHLRVSLRMMEFGRINPFADPREFWDHYAQRLGPLEIPIPDRARRTINPTDVDFRVGTRPRKTFVPLLIALYDTAIIARALLKSLDNLGIDYAREATDGISRIWGSRIAQLAACKVTTRGAEIFSALNGKVILVFNHSSNLDFALDFLAVGAARLAGGRRLRPRFIAARDHFVDNRLIYNFMGVGRMMEAVDMVFVDRKQSDAGKAAITQAAATLAGKEIDIAIFPQGTRAYGTVDLRGRRLDAGYYTTVHGTGGDLAHLKKGVGYLALDTALATAPRNLPVHLVCVGITGTGTALAKQSVRLQTETEIHFQIGQVITVAPEDVSGMTRGDEAYQAKVKDLIERIDQGLVAAMGLNRRLKIRFLGESRNERAAAVLDRPEIARIAYPLLDRVWTLPKRLWPGYIKEAASLLEKSPEPAALQPLLDRVTAELVKRG